MEREIVELNDLDFLVIASEYFLDEDAYDQVEDTDNEKYFENERYIGGNELWDNFDIIEDDKIIDYDLEDGYIYNEVILKRLLDGKYFKTKLCYSTYLSYMEANENEKHLLTEVFPTQQTITIYE